MGGGVKRFAMVFSSKRHQAKQYLNLNYSSNERREKRYDRRRFRVLLGFIVN